MTTDWSGRKTQRKVGGIKIVGMKVNDSRIDVKKI